MFKRLKEILGINDCPAQICPLCGGRGNRCELFPKYTKAKIGDTVRGKITICPACGGIGIYKYTPEAG